MVQFTGAPALRRLRSSDGYVDPYPVGITLVLIVDTRCHSLFLDVFIQHDPTLTTTIPSVTLHRSNSSSQTTGHSDRGEALVGFARRPSESLPPAHYSARPIRAESHTAHISKARTGLLGTIH